MTGLTKRVTALEAATGTETGRWHRVIVPVGQTLDDAVDHYGRDLIRADDRLVVRRIVSGSAATSMAGSL